MQSHNNYYFCTGDLPNKIDVQSVISTYMDFGTVSASESASIMTILNANNFTTAVCVTELGSVAYLETKSSYVCYTSYVTRKLYQTFLAGTSIDNRIERFKYYGRKYSKLPPCLPLNGHSDGNGTETLHNHNGGSSKPWTATVHPDRPIWKEATFPIYGFNHYVHYLQPCSEAPQLCQHHANNSANTCDCM